MAKYTVSLPIVGALVVEVEADNESTAIAMAIERQEGGRFEWEIQSFFVAQFHHGKNIHGQWHGAAVETKEDCSVVEST